MPKYLAQARFPYGTRHLTAGSVFDGENEKLDPLLVRLGKIRLATDDEIKAAEKAAAEKAQEQRGQATPAAGAKSKKKTSAAAAPALAPAPTTATPSPAPTPAAPAPASTGSGWMSTTSARALAPGLGEPGTEPGQNPGGNTGNTESGV